MTHRPRRPATVCGHCGTPTTSSAVILEITVCDICRLRARRAIQPCPGCDQPRVLAFYDSQRQPACARCTGNQPVYACIDCGREDNPFGRRCAPCALHIRLTALLADHTGAVHPQLQPVFDALMAARRPQSVHYWLTRASSRPDILTRMAAGELPISHHAFASQPPSRAVTYVRDLLAATGVIEPYHSGLESVPGWLTELLATLPAQHADLIDRFTRWDLLRRFRLHPHGHNLSRHSVHHARSKVLATTRFLAWLTDHELAPATCRQADLDHYLSTHPGIGDMLKPFIDWAIRTELTRALRIPGPPRPVPQVTLTDEQRWQQVEQLLHDETIALHARVAGLFPLLFAQPLGRVLHMRTHQISSTTPVSVTFDTTAIELPEIVDQLLIRQLNNALAHPTNQAEQWLFPGRQPGRPLTRENIRHTLVRHGIHPGQARKAAMFQLTSQIPTPVLADLLGLSPVTATRWASLAARDWSQCTAMRHRQTTAQKSQVQ